MGHERSLTKLRCYLVGWGEAAQVESWAAFVLSD